MNEVEKQHLALAQEYAASLEAKIVEYSSMWGTEAMMVALSRRERNWLRRWRLAATLEVSA